MDDHTRDLDLKAILARQAALEEQVAKLSAENAHFRHLLWGRKSEKSNRDIDGQLSLFGPPPEAEPAPAAEDSTTVTSHKRKKRGGREEIPDHLPRQDVVIDVPEEQRCCDLCEAQMVPFKDAVSERVHLVPASVVVIRTIRKQYRCPDGHALASAPPSPEILPRSKYDTSVAVHLAISKYADHLPLHRQVEVLKRAGIKIPKSTVCDLVMRLGELVAPIVKAMAMELKAGTYIQSDDTPITVLTDGQKGSKKGHVWIWRREHLVVFLFSFSRGRDGPLAFLGDWKGDLQTDGLQSYAAVVKANGLTHHGCWAHVRRKFVDCERAGEERVKPLLALINQLFGVEREVRAAAQSESLLEQLGEARRTTSLDLLEQIHQEALRLENDPSISKASALAKALGYLDRQWASLIRFVQAPQVMIHNNDAERALRSVAVGRKNWLFAGSERGARVAATMYSLLGTCRVLELPMDRYLAGVAERLMMEPETDPAELTPWAWARSNGIELPAAVDDAS